MPLQLFVWIIRQLLQALQLIRWMLADARYKSFRCSWKVPEVCSRHVGDFGRCPTSSAMRRITDMSAKKQNRR